MPVSRDAHSRDTHVGTDDVSGPERGLGMNQRAVSSPDDASDCDADTSDDKRTEML